MKNCQYADSFCGLLCYLWRRFGYPDYHFLENRASMKLVGVLVIPFLGKIGPNEADW